MNKSEYYSSENVTTALTIPGFLLGLMLQLAILPYFYKAATILYSVVSPLRPPKKAIGLSLEANGLRTNVLGGLTSKLVLKLLSAFSPASILVKVTIALLAKLLSC